MSVSWIALTESELNIYFNICSLSTGEKGKGDSSYLLHSSPVMSISRWFIYFTMNLTDRNWAAFGIFCKFKITYITGKQGIQNFYCINIFLTISSFSIKISFFFDVTLSERKRFMVFHKDFLFVTFFIKIMILILWFSGKRHTVTTFSILFLNKIISIFQ